MILSCSCSNQAQDSFHGKGRRVHNVCKGDSKARCTVCKSEKPLSAQQIKDLKKEEE